MSRNGGDYTPGRTRTSKFSVGTGSQYPSTVGSTVFGDSLDDIHIFSGSVIITGSFSLSGTVAGTIPSIGSSTDNAVVRWNGTAGSAIQNSNVIVDDSNNMFVSGNLEATGSTRFGYSLSQTHIFTGSLYVTGNLDVTGSSLLTTELYGTTADAADSVGVKLGSSNTYSTNGSKLVSFVNNATEKGYVDYTGQMGLLYSANGGKLEFKMASENLSMASGAYTDSAIQIPAGAICMSVAARVTADFAISGSYYPSSSVFSIGTSATAAKWGSGIVTNSGNTNSTSSMMAGFEYFNSNTSIRITPEVYHSDLGTGSVRLEVRYIQTTVPTS